jgi:MscS family membrane protein
MFGMVFDMLKGSIEEIIPMGDVFGLSYVNIVYSLAVILGSVIIAKIVFFLLKNWISRLVAKTETSVDDEILEVVRKPIYYLIILIGIFYGLGNFIPENLNSIYGILFYLLAVVVVVKAAIGASAVLITHSIEKTTGSKDISHLLKKLTKIAIVIIGIVIVLGAAGVEITPLLASLGVAGLAVALALQETLANFFSGIYIVADKTFGIGDVIKLSSGEMGRVQKIGTRSTRIKTFDNTIITLTNDQIAKSRVVNLSAANEIIRTKVPIGVGYDSDPNQVKDLLEKIANNQEKVITDSVNAYFINFGDSALQFELQYRTKLSDRVPTLDLINTLILKEFRKAKIDIPFPIRTVYMEK